MAKKAGRKKIFVKKIDKSLRCPFCVNKSEPVYKDSEILSKFITERGKIMPRAYSGVCAKHQRHLSLEIKRARHLGLLPYKSTI